MYRQYDHMVRTGTVIRPGEGDAAVVRLPETERGVAISVGCNGRMCALSPRRGAAMAVAEAAVNVACVGARPAAITDCLNFASPERPAVMWSFSEAIDGLALACEALDAPVVSGNVSFYNETEGRGIHPTPIVGLVGLMPEAARAVGLAFTEAGLDVLLLGRVRPELAGSEYAAAVGVPLSGDAPDLDLAAVRSLVDGLLALHEDGLVASAHDVAEGGLAVALAECTFGNAPIGLVASLPDREERLDACLFGEGTGRVVLATREVARVEALCARYGVPTHRLGVTGGDRLRIESGGRPVVDATIETLSGRWAAGFGEAVE